MSFRTLKVHSVHSSFKGTAQYARNGPHQHNSKVRVGYSRTSLCMVSILVPMFVTTWPALACCDPCQQHSNHSIGRASAICLIHKGQVDNCSPGFRDLVPHINYELLVLDLSLSLAQVLCTVVTLSSPQTCVCDHGK